MQTPRHSFPWEDIMKIKLIKFTEAVNHITNTEFTRWNQIEWKKKKKNFLKWINFLIIQQAGRRLRGKVQGLCGDLNEESIFEFRGPRRCILSSGSVMAASYQTSWHHPQCRIRPEVAERLRHERKNCPRLEAKFTLLPHIVPHNFN